MCVKAMVFPLVCLGRVIPTGLLLKEGGREGRRDGGRALVNLLFLPSSPSFFHVLTTTTTPLGQGVDTCPFSLVGQRVCFFHGLRDGCPTHAHAVGLALLLHHFLLLLVLWVCL